MKKLFLKLMIIFSQDESAMMPDKRRFDSAKYEREFKWLYFSAASGGFSCKFCEHFNRNSPSESSVFVGRKLGTHPSRILQMHETSKFHKRATEKYFGTSSNNESVMDMLKKQSTK